MLLLSLLTSREVLAFRRWFVVNFLQLLGLVSVFSYPGFSEAVELSQPHKHSVRMQK